VAVIFPRWTNWIPLVVVGGLALAVPSITFAVLYWFSPEYTDVGYAPKQPVPFSHKLHAGELGLDCRYCHYTVEKAGHAAVPSTETCMGCHTAIRNKSEKLTLVRESYNTGKPVEWIRVHMLPDYAYFNHSVHVAAGVGCATCHGRIDKMTVVRQAKPLSMSWCLDCHRAPNKHLRPREQVTNMAWTGKGYTPSVKETHRSKRVDIQRLRKALLNETAKTPVRMAQKSHGGKMAKEKIERIVVNPPEHCSGCHR